MNGLRNMSDINRNLDSKKKPPRLKALLLSALVFPGLGQYVLGKKKLGLLIMALTGFCVYVVVSQVYAEMNALMAHMEQTGMVDFMSIQEESERISKQLNNPGFISASYGLAGLWIFSIVEVFRKTDQKKN